MRPNRCMLMRNYQDYAQQLNCQDASTAIPKWVDKTQFLNKSEDHGLFPGN